MKIDNQERKDIIEKQNLSYRSKVNKNKKNIFKSVVKEIKITGKKIYWKNKFLISYYYKSFVFFISKKKIIKSKISILIPTRERVLKFERFINSIVKNTLSIDRCEFLVLVDPDDPEKEEYIKFIDGLKYQKLDIKIFHENLQTHAKRNNFLATKSSGEILFPANDDMIFITKEWDHLLDTEFSKNLKGTVVCMGKLR